MYRFIKDRKRYYQSGDQTLIEIREKDAVTILNYIKDNPECLIGELMEIETGIKEERQREVIEDLDITYNMISLGHEGWEISEITLDYFNKTKKWLALEQSEFNAMITDMYKKGQIRGKEPKTECG